jgi:hypothetical protein
MMAPESLRTLESPETSNVLATEGFSRKKKKEGTGMLGCRPYPT